MGNATTKSAESGPRVQTGGSAGLAVRVALLAAAATLGGLCFSGCRAMAPATPAVTAVTAADFYVSPQGKDTWSGRRAAPAADGSDGPFATVGAAQAAVRQARAAGPVARPTTVLIRGGTYALAQPWVFRPGDSGTAASPVVYAAYPGEQPVISGGIPITGWVEAGRGVWKAPVPGAQGGKWVFRRLYVDGYRRPLARTPNEGEYFRVADRVLSLVDPATGKEVDAAKFAFKFNPGDLKAWPRLGEITAVVQRNWESAILPIKTVDEAQHRVVFTGEMKWVFDKNLRYYVEGFREALDAPGEWWLDRQDGMLYYRPRRGESMRRLSVVAPRLTELVRLEGQPELGLHVENLVFDGLAFRHADYAVEPEGHSDWQAAVTVPAAFQADGARHIAIRRCELRNLGTYAVWFRRGCSANTVEQTEIADLGAGGVRVGESGVPKEEYNRTHHNTVDNCFIHDGGSVYYGAHPVWVGQSSDNAVTHNELCDFNYTGISVGWSWGFAPTDCHRNRIEYNHLHHLGRGVLFDMAAIYTLGISTGTTIRCNRIHHIWGWEEGYGAGGIYPDEGSSGLLIENNLVYETQVGGLTVHYGRENMVRNNIFAFGQRAQIHLGREDKQSSQTLLNNIVYFREGRFIERLSTLTADNNVYWRTDGAAIEFPGGLDFAAWQAKGYDRHSLIADPLFANAEKYDFRLRPESPALKLGFRPFDAEIAKAGLTGPADWVRRPSLVRRPKATMGVAKARPPLTVRDGFEESPVDGPPAFANVHGATAAAYIRVTDKVAATGKRSLMFVDAPGLDQPWNPHLYLYPRLRTGVLHGSFDLRLEPGAEFWHEWRTGESSFIGGVSLSAKAGGDLTFNGKSLGPAPVGVWMHVEMLCDLRPKDTRIAAVAVTVPGEKAPRVTALPTTLSFNAMDWVVYVANGNQAGTFYLDNVVLESRRR